ncbi:Transcriptional regulatory protein BasR [Stieleria maiorica]|uniref:Transcriptional regulatory protein BasR n=1 Tax=Stieleria maiorica TaxID=2795974 RepID=A0A5B9MAT4_9BACT|nr:response regulator [Stieleria maiorica]QEF98248.1 Transcriptional regulatory protein BasR [Stieleria maiorica]
MSSKTASSTVIVLVEDDDVDALLFERTLAGCDGSYELHVHCTLESAMQWIEQHHCDVVLLDYSLPDSFGLDGLRRLQSRFARLPVVMLTGLDDPQAAIDAHDHGATDYLVKGIVPSSELDQTLQRAARGARLAVADK